MSPAHLGITALADKDVRTERHVPRILDLERQPAGYRRTYPIPHDAELPEDFDVITELEFASRADYDARAAEAYAPTSGIAAGVANFLDRTRTRSYAAEQHLSY